MLHQNAPGRSPVRPASALLGIGSAVILLATGAASAVAAPQYGLYNTGIDPGIMMGVDAHYTVKPIAAPAAAVTYVTDTTGLPFSPPANALSAFISPQPSYAAGQIDAGGVYVFTTTFTLTATEVNNASIFGRFESDDRINDVILNGNSLGISLTDPDYYAFSQYFNLVTSRSFLVVGTNTLSFQVFNFTNNNRDPVALRAEFSAVPEPSTCAMFGGVAALLAGSTWLRRRS